MQNEEMLADLARRVEALENAMGHINEFIGAASTMIEKHQHLHEVDADVNENIISNVGMLSKSSSTTALILYWLMHAMEHIDKVVPEGTGDLVLNCVEENIDEETLQDTPFWSLFNNLRNA